MSIYNFSVSNIEDQSISLEKYKGKVLVIVNTASKCGFTPQYADLQKLYEKYAERGLEILAFPCNQFEEQEPGDNKEVKEFCLLNYGVSFSLFKKVEVRGKNAHELFKHLTEKAPFKGLDQSSPIGRILYNILNEKYPEYLVDDSIKWNFTKFLIDREGNVLKRFEPTFSPLDMEEEIVGLL